VRDHTRLKGAPSAVSETQANELSLALGTVAVRPIQTVVRLRGTRSGGELRLEAVVTGPDALILRPGQRARAFTMQSRSQMVQARVERISRTDQKAHVQVRLSTLPVEHSGSAYVVEIVVERGSFLSVPNDALIEEQTHRTVYVRTADGDFVARQIDTGIQGEIYTAVTAGLEPGDQVVTTGSFFIDSDYKMKGGD